MCRDNCFRHCRWILFLVLTLCGLPGLETVRAQILNIEKHRLNSDSSSLLLKGSLGMQLFNRSAAADDPVNLFGINASINAQYNPGEHALIAIAQSNYLEINENPWLNFGFAHLRGHFFSVRATSFETYGQYSYDNFRGLDPRVLLGTNIRHSLTANGKFEFIVGGGPMYEWERWNHPSRDEVREVSFLKLSSFVIIRQSLSEWVDFNTIVYYQSGYDDAIGDFRHRYSGTININTRLSKRWSLNNSFHYTYEDKPIVPITKFIFDWRVSLSIDL